ncbi:DUF5320 domain-containing protein [Oceanidesulfovibrio indonesiensis]|nr:DUF5320 domain-containing protein [Oceanidesulfovibrio indonesiensis]
MPGFDGTGPWGKGPMTGGGFGYCVQAAGGEPIGAMRGFGGRRGGGRMGRGCFGRGLGRSVEPWEMTTPVDEKSFLESRLSRIEEEAARIKGRLDALES